MKIHAISNYRFNTANFEGQKSKQTQAPMHKATPLKAVPVALLVAMSPINLQNASAQISPAQLEHIQRTEDKLEGQYVCPNATPDGSSGKINMYMSRDGEEYIKLSLIKKTEATTMNNGDFVDIVKTSQIDIRPEEFIIETINHGGRGKSSKETKYYVVGSGIRYITQVNDAQTGEPIIKSHYNDILNIESQKFEITKEFYDLISKNPYNTVPTSNENTLVFSSGLR